MKRCSMRRLLLCAIGFAVSVCAAGAEDCRLVEVLGGLSLGIAVVDDPACASLPTGLDCITTRCRYCRTKLTSESLRYQPCPPTDADVPPSTVLRSLGASEVVPLGSPECVAMLSETQVAVKLSAVADATCVTKSMGCITERCRLCRNDDVAVLASFQTCRAILSTSAIVAPASNQCTMQISANESALGVSVLTDLSCVEGSPGCLGFCRFCKQPTSSVTGLDFCSSFTNATATAPAPSTNTMTNNNAPPINETHAPALGESAPTNQSVCLSTLPTAQQLVGLKLVTDATCTSGGTGIGCFGNSCRLCKFFDSNYTGDLPTCSAVMSGSVPFNAVAETASESKCSLPSPPGAADLGLFVITDTACATNGFGCLSSLCRVCKVFNTDMTKSLSFCESTPGASDDKQQQVTPTNGESNLDESESQGHTSRLMSTAGVVAACAGTIVGIAAIALGVKKYRERRERAANGGHISV